MSEQDDVGDAEKSSLAIPNDDSPVSQEVHFRDLAPAIEFACWIVVLLAPLLRLGNGPAVTNDQFVIQVALSFLALSGAVALRIYQMFSTD